MKEKAKIFLISPPMVIGTAPWLGISILKPYLNGKGVVCETADLNVRFFYWLWEEGNYIEMVSREAIAAFNQFQEKERLYPGENRDFTGLINSLSIIPAYLLKRYLKEEVLEGTAYERDPGTWPGNLMSTSYILTSIQGAFAQDDPVSLRDIPRGIERYFESFKGFLVSPGIASILEQASRANIVGLSVPCTKTQFLFSLVIAREIRRLNPEVFIIFGGAGLSMLHEKKKKEILLNNDYIDAIGLYDCENMLLDLAAAVTGSKNLEEVPNLLYYDRKPGKFVQTPLQQVMHPDELPTPEFNENEVQLYSQAVKRWFPGIRLPVLVARGCYWGKCTFCGDPLVQQPNQPRYLHRSVEKVVEDVEKLQSRYNAYYFCLASPALEPNWIKHFSEEVVRRGISAKFWCYLRMIKHPSMDRRFFLLLKEAGFDYINCGVESTCDHVLEKLKKGNTREEVTYVIRGLSSAGIRTKFNLIVDLPFAAVEDIAENWKFVKENISFIDDLTPYRYAVVDQTPMAKEPDKFNIKLITNADGTPKYKNQYNLAYKNLFYQQEGAKKIVQDFLRLNRTIQLYKFTKTLRERISATGFSWEPSFVLFRPFTVVGSRFSLRDHRNSKKNYFMFLDDIYIVVEIPGSFKDLILLFQRAVREPVPYGELLEAFERGFQGRQDDGDLPVKETWNRLLIHFVYEGFIRDIYSEPCLLHTNTEFFHGQAYSVSTPGADTDIFSGSIMDVESDKSLPFVFFSTPFAGVAQTKLM